MTSNVRLLPIPINHPRARYRAELQPVNVRDSDHGRLSIPVICGTGELEQTFDLEVTIRASLEIEYTIQVVRRIGRDYDYTSVTA